MALTASKSLEAESGGKRPSSSTRSGGLRKSTGSTSASLTGGLRKSTGTASMSITKSVSFSDFGAPEPSGGEEEDRHLSGGVPDGPLEIDECEVIPLLKVSTPSARAAGALFQVRMLRASLEQSYGVSFQATSNESGLSSVMVAEDAPHLGLCEADRLVTINGVMPESVQECARILKSAMSIALVLERQHHRTSVASGRSSQQSADGAGTAPRLLLLSTRPQVLNAERGTFRLSMVRSSLHQRFGVGFSARLGARAGSKAAAVLAQDLPHLGLLAGDQLLAINGSRAAHNVDFQRTLQNSRDITLVMQRRPSKLNRLVPQVEPIEDDEWLSEEVVTYDALGGVMALDDAGLAGGSLLWACAPGSCCKTVIDCADDAQPPGRGHVLAALKAA
eukprot:CAMPEP_0168411150 /NCGR_PEP_ID=MMETSP0228-20121227/28055_1 /TAXON_ID=133427 /ORGANISM="Protoceratium reticulatum, Strain CCCM 535 (=CCMP 1889)" /LENGTH=390 /DNA_ID=CAMNT_0008424893 /DNA_START=9 /DNA_END=1182 /DNA_ORIENTATION=+